MTALQSPDVSHEQRIESGHGLADKLRNSIQAWQERCTLENPRFVERYKEGKLHVLLKFSTGVVPKEYVIVFEGKPNINKNIPSIRTLAICEQFGKHARHVNPQVPANDCDREPMFIDDAQAVQAPENLPLPSWIWFNCADRVYSVLPYALYLSKVSGFILAGTTARKVDMLTFSSVCSTPEGTCKIVHSRPKILNSVPSNGKDRGVDWPYVRKAIDGASLCIHLADRFVWPTPYEFGDLDFKILDVMIGPFDFEPN
jgi:hypothetical protein